MVFSEVVNSDCYKLQLQWCFVVELFTRKLDCKTVGFFLKISKEIGKAWHRSLTREAREPCCFQPR